MRKFPKKPRRQRFGPTGTAGIFAGKERYLKLLAEGADDVPLGDITEVDQDAAEFFVTFLLQGESIFQIFVRRSGRGRAAIDQEA